MFLEYNSIYFYLPYLVDRDVNRSVCSVVLSIIFHMLFGQNKRHTRTNEERDDESMSGSEDIEGVFVVGADGKRKHTTEKRLFLCMLFIDCL